MQVRFLTRAIDPHQQPDCGPAKAGTGFIFPFHFKLHIGWLDLGYWIVVA
jgi:hypothetical protein